MSWTAKSRRNRRSTEGLGWVGLDWRFFVLLCTHTDSVFCLFMRGFVVHGFSDSWVVFCRGRWTFGGG